MTYSVEAWMVIGDDLRVPKPATLLDTGMRSMQFLTVASEY